MAWRRCELTRDTRESSRPHTRIFWERHPPTRITEERPQGPENRQSHVRKPAALSRVLPVRTSCTSEVPEEEEGETFRGAECEDEHKM